MKRTELEIVTIRFKQLVRQFVYNTDIQRSIQETLLEYDGAYDADAIYTPKYFREYYEIKDYRTFKNWLTVFCPEIDTSKRIYKNKKDVELIFSRLGTERHHYSKDELHDILHPSENFKKSKKYKDVHDDLEIANETISTQFGFNIQQNLSFLPPIYGRVCKTLSDELFEINKFPKNKEYSTSELKKFFISESKKDMFERYKNLMLKIFGEF